MQKARGGIKEFGQRISELLQERSQPAPPSPSRSPSDRPTPDSSERPPAADARQMLEHVRAALGERAELTIGRVNFVDLDGIKARLGARWPRVADRVDAIVRRAIERRLDTSDLYIPLAGHRYLITYGRLSPAEAALKTAMIGEEITRILVGEDFVGETLDVRTAVARVDGTLDFEEIPSVQQMVERLYEAPETQAEDPSKPELGAETDAAEDDPLAGVQLVYRPMWDVRRKVVSTFVYVPAVPRGSGQFAIGRAAIPSIEEPEVLRRLDVMTITAALADLARVAEHGRKLLLDVPVHFESIATTSRRAEYMKYCRVVPPDLQQFLIFELLGVPAGVPQSRLIELTMTLKRYSRSVLLRLPLVDPLFRSAGETGVNVVGASLVGLRLRERQIMRAFDRFCEGAQKAGLQTYVHGLRTLSLTTAAVSAGFDYIDGDIVTSVVDEPGEIYRFDARAMVRNWAIGNT